METDIKKTSFTLYRVVSILGIAFSAVFLVTFAIMVGYLSSNAGMMMPPDIAILQLFQNGGFISILTLVLFVGLLAKKGNKENFSKTLMWALMILCVVYCSAFLEYIASASQIPAESMMDTASIYVPALGAAAAFIGLLSGWEKQFKAKAKVVAIVASIIAIGFAIYFICRMFYGLGLINDLVAQGASNVTNAQIMEQVVQMLMMASGPFVAAMLAFLVFCMCQSTAHFDAIALGAANAEEAEAKAPGEVNAFIEEMISVDKTEAAEAKETPAEAVEEAAQDIAEDIKEINDKILDGEKE